MENALWRVKEKRIKLFSKTSTLTQINRKNSLQAYLMILPMIIGISLFTLYPMLWLMKWSLFMYDGYSTPTFIGMDNFVRAFTRETGFWSALSTTFSIMVIKVILEISLALLLAVLINKKGLLNSIFRTFFFLPSIISVAIIGLIFFLMFEPYQGVVNSILQSTGIINDRINWFGTKWHAISVIIIGGIWHSFGINMVYFLMGLQSIPKELYECARIDGANEVQQFFKITIPMLAPVMQVIMMLAVLGTMKMTDMVLVLTNGHPGGQSEVVMTYIYKYFFGGDGVEGASQFGFASALAVITALILAMMTLIYLRLSKRMSRVF
jgi:raffinose/stachyose/melibiose transport system permease protein